MLEQNINKSCFLLSFKVLFLRKNPDFDLLLGILIFMCLAHQKMMLPNTNSIPMISNRLYFKIVVFVHSQAKNLLRVTSYQLPIKNKVSLISHLVGQEQFGNQIQYKSFLCQTLRKFVQTIKKLARVYNN